MKLYRFEKPDGVRIETLKRNEIWMALPESLNDPLDCRLKINDKTEFSTFKIEKIKSAAGSLYESYNIKGGAWLLDDAIIESIQAWIDAKGRGGNGAPAFLSLIEKKIMTFGVQCFSEADYTNPLMWAHYALNHEGFCIEYEYLPMTLALENNSDFAMSPAIYTSRLPEFNLMEILFSPKEVTEKLYATKSNHWAYEKEFRLVYFPCSPLEKKKGQSVSIPKGLKITKIISGLKAHKIEQELNSIADELNVTYHRIKNSAHFYDLEL